VTLPPGLSKLLALTIACAHWQWRNPAGGTMDNSILIIDDDRELCQLLAEFLHREGFSTVAIHDGAEAVAHCRTHSHDAIVLDIMLPGIQGLEVLRQLRQFTAVPVLMLTARGEDTDRIIGLELGADDYLPKPCNPRELAARLRAILRRTANIAITPRDAVLEVAGVRLNTADRSASYADSDLHLTSAEFNLLRELLTHAGEVVDKATLSERGLGRALTPYDRSVDVHVSHLRKKLARLGSGKLILSVRGEGYQYCVGDGVAAG
jgi:DNA-binding response OmpR family regulator